MSFKYALQIANKMSPEPDLSMPRLVTVGFSHFCEKARWGLDLSPMKYYEEIHGPGFHLSSTLLRLAKSPRIVPWKGDAAFLKALESRKAANPKVADRKEKTAIPKLVLPQATLTELKLPPISGQVNFAVVSDGSSGILKLLSMVYPKELGHLYPLGSVGNTVISLEGYLETELGNAASKWSFSNLLLTGANFYNGEDGSATILPSLNEPTLDYFMNIASNMDGIPYVEKLILNIFAKRHLVPLMAKANGATAESRQHALQCIHTVFQRMDELLKKHNPTGSATAGGYLLGTEKLTAADISFAALCGPVLFPPQAKHLFTSFDNVLSNTEVKNVPGCVNMAELALLLKEKYLSARYVLELYRKCRFIGDYDEGRCVVPKIKSK